MLKNLIKKAFIRSLFSTQTKAVDVIKKYSQKITKSRALMGLYELQPKICGEIFIAPDATLVGQIYLGMLISIGHRTILRGDINSIKIHQNVAIGDNCVLHTASCLPSGLPADLIITVDCVICSGCTLYSCYLDRSCFIGANSVILQGARLESGVVLLPNSVVPPGRVVPANQVWGGNPIKFIRFAKEQERFLTRIYAQSTFQQKEKYKYQFLPYNDAYLFRKQDPQNDKVKACDTILHVDLKLTIPRDPSNPTV